MLTICYFICMSTVSPGYYIRGDIFADIAGPPARPSNLQLYPQPLQHGLRAEWDGPIWGMHVPVETYSVEALKDNNKYWQYLDTVRPTAARASVTTKQTTSNPAPTCSALYRSTTWVLDRQPYRVLHKLTELLTDMWTRHKGPRPSPWAARPRDMINAPNILMVHMSNERCGRTAEKDV